MRIGVNALYLIPGGVGGTEIYLRNLLAACAETGREHEWLVFVNRETGADLAPRAANFTTIATHVRAANRPARILYEQTALPREAARRGVEVLFNPGFTMPLFCPCPSVTVFHDLQHKRHPEHFRWFDLPFWRLLLYGSARRATRLIAVSQATRADLGRYFGVPEDRVTVVPHGVEEAFFRAGRDRAPDAGSPYLLSVSTLHPHKNIERLVRVFARFRAAQPRYRLVLAGMHGFQTQAVRAEIDRLDLAAHVEMPGWLPREDLIGLYRRAWAFVYPSTFEGFGMPVLEALAAGLPVACSRIPPLEETAGGAALLFDPLSDEELLAALVRISEDAPWRRDAAVRGPARAAQYRWQDAARATIHVLEQASAAR